MRIVNNNKTIGHHRYIKKKRKNKCAPRQWRTGTGTRNTSNRWPTANTQHIVLSYHPSHLSMEISRTARLYFLLVLDLIFFVLEISIGQSTFPSFPFLYSFIPCTQVTLLALSRSSQIASTCSSIPTSPYHLQVF